MFYSVMRTCSGDVDIPKDKQAKEFIELDSKGLQELQGMAQRDEFFDSSWSHFVGLTLKISKTAQNQEGIVLACD
jgi:hypothetical protein